MPLIKTEDIDNQAVTSEKIADEAVTNEKIGSKAVTEDKVAADSVGTEEIINQSVTTAKIADGSVTIPKLGNDVEAWRSKTDVNIEGAFEQIKQEANSRKSADDTLTQNLSDEAKKREEADDETRKSLSDETTARENADQQEVETRSKAIEDEKQARSSADDAIRKTASDDKAELKQYLAEEKAAREKADKTTNDRIDAVSLIVEQEDSSVTIKPGVLNHWGSPVTTLNITLADGVEGEQNDYKLQFKTGTGTPKITFPSNVKWANGEADWDPNTTYEVSILNGLAIAAAWEDEG